MQIVFCIISALSFVFFLLSLQLLQGFFNILTYLLVYPVLTSKSYFLVTWCIKIPWFQNYFLKTKSHTEQIFKMAWGFLLYGFPWWLRLEHLPTMRETWVQSLGREDLLKKEMATHFSILAWKFPWMEEPGGYSPPGCKELDTTEWLHCRGGRKKWINLWLLVGD